MLIGSAGYIADTVKGKTKPNRVTWGLSAVSVFVMVFAELSDGVTWSVLPLIATGLGPLLIFLVSFLNKNAYWKLGKLDYVCGACSVLALVLWKLTNDPALAILFGLLSDGMASVPTLIKSWKDPESESIIIFALGIPATLTSIIAIQSWSFVETAFPFYCLILNTIFVLVISRKNARRIL
jgi:hypothetical protein